MNAPSHPDAAGRPAGQQSANLTKAATVTVLAFAGGFVIMSLELLGGRMLAPWFGSSIYVWGSIITVFMLALALGYLVGGRLSLHAPTLTRFAIIFLGAGCILGPLALAAEPITTWVFDRIHDPRYGSLVAALALFVAPTVVLGMISPYSVSLLVRVREESGKVAGTLYFVSTIGSALGTLATSFYFVLWFEVNSIIITLSATLLALGVVAMALDRVAVHGR